MKPELDYDAAYFVMRHLCMAAEHAMIPEPPKPAPEPIVLKIEKPKHKIVVHSAPKHEEFHRDHKVVFMNKKEEYESLKRRIAMLEQSLHVLEERGTYDTFKLERIRERLRENKEKVKKMALEVFGH